MTRGPLPRSEYEAIYARVPRLTVELVAVRDGAVLLSLREDGACRGLWHLPGGTVRFGEPLPDAVARVARDELAVGGRAGELLGYIEYPSHLALGLDWPVGIAFRVGIDRDEDPAAGRSQSVRWWSQLPAEMHEEQRRFLVGHGIVRAAPKPEGRPAGGSSLPESVERRCR